MYNVLLFFWEEGLGKNLSLRHEQVVWYLPSLLGRQKWLS